MKNLFKKLLVVNILIFTLVGCFGGEDNIDEVAKSYFDIVLYKDAPDEESFNALKELNDKLNNDMTSMVASNNNLPEDFSIALYDANKKALQKIQTPTIEVTDVEGDKNSKIIIYSFYPLDYATSLESSNLEFTKKIEEIISTGSEPTEEQVVDFSKEALISSYESVIPSSESITVSTEFKNIDGNWVPADNLSFLTTLLPSLFQY